MRIIDFRMRPNTTEYMGFYTGPANALLWRRFGFPEPAAVPLDYFVAEAHKHDIDLGVFTGRNSNWGHLDNQYVKEAAAQTAGLLYTAYGIDPSSAERDVELQAAAGDERNIGIALDPPGNPVARHPIGFDDDELMFPIYEFAAAHKLVTVLTMGPFVGQFYGDPLPIERIARTFPICAWSSHTDVGLDPKSWRRRRTEMSTCISRRRSTPSIRALMCSARLLRASSPTR